MNGVWSSPIENLSTNDLQMIYNCHYWDNWLNWNTCFWWQNPSLMQSANASEEGRNYQYGSWVWRSAWIFILWNVSSIRRQGTKAWHQERKNLWFCRHSWVPLVTDMNNALASEDLFFHLFQLFLQGVQSILHMIPKKSCIQITHRAELALC